MHNSIMLARSQESDSNEPIAVHTLCYITGSAHRIPSVLSSMLKKSLELAASNEHENYEKMLNQHLLIAL